MPEIALPSERRRASSLALIRLSRWLGDISFCARAVPCAHTEPKSPSTSTTAGSDKVIGRKRIVKTSKKLYAMVGEGFYPLTTSPHILTKSQPSSSQCQIRVGQ